MSNEEQCFVLLILQVINFFLLTSAFFKALKGILFHFLCLLCVSYKPDLKCSWVIYEHLSCVSSFFIKSVL